jgi:hypothetical protein
MFSVAGLLLRSNGEVLSITLRNTRVNRDGAGSHAISTVPIDVDNVELRYSRRLGDGRLSVGLGYDDPALAAESDSRIHGFVNWQQGF